VKGLRVGLVIINVIVYVAIFAGLIFIADYIYYKMNIILGILMISVGYVHLQGYWFTPLRLPYSVGYLVMGKKVGKLAQATESMVGKAQGRKLISKVYHDIVKSVCEFIGSNFNVLVVALCCGRAMLWSRYVVVALCCGRAMLWSRYVVVTLCCGRAMLWARYVVSAV
jgi:hypothetical protein